jgi:hypothetical protein
MRIALQIFLLLEASHRNQTMSLRATFPIQWHREILNWKRCRRNDWSCFFFFRLGSLSRSNTHESKHNHNIVYREAQVNCSENFPVRRRHSFTENGRTYWLLAVINSVELFSCYASCYVYRFKFLSRHTAPWFFARDWNEYIVAYSNSYTTIARKNVRCLITAR